MTNFKDTYNIDDLIGLMGSYQKNNRSLEGSIKLDVPSKTYHISPSAVEIIQNIHEDSDYDENPSKFDPSDIETAMIEGQVYLDSNFESFTNESKSTFLLSKEEHLDSFENFDKFTHTDLPMVKGDYVNFSDLEFED